MSLITSSMCLWNHLRDGDSTTSLGSLFQCFTMFSVNKLFPISNLNLFWCSMQLFLLILSLAAQSWACCFAITHWRALISVWCQELFSFRLVSTKSMSLNSPCARGVVVGTLKHPWPHWAEGLPGTHGWRRSWDPALRWEQGWCWWSSVNSTFWGLDAKCCVFEGE